LRFSFRSRSASFAAAVVFPEPCRPASRITVGGRPPNASCELPAPMSAVSSSWTIFTTCWPGVRLFATSAPSARSRTRATKSFTTLKLTSASSSARRISRMAREIASSSRRPRPRRSPRAAWSLSDSVSNIGPQVYWRPFRGYPVQVPTERSGNGRRREGRDDHRLVERGLCGGGRRRGLRGGEDAARDHQRGRDLDERRGRERPHHPVPHDRQYRLRSRTLTSGATALSST